MVPEIQKQFKDRIFEADEKKEDKYFSVYRNYMMTSFYVNAIEHGCEVAEWTYVGINKIKLLKEIIDYWSKESVCLNI